MKRLGLLSLIACGTASDTAMRVRVDFEPALQLEQLGFSSSAGAQIVFGPELRPVRPGGLLASGDSLLVLMPDALAGTDVTCPVDGLFQGEVVARGGGTARLVGGGEVECVAQLERVKPVEVDAGPTCAGCIDDKDNCKSGMENGACGSGGVRCVPCTDGRRCQGFVCA